MHILDLNIFKNKKGIISTNLIYSHCIEITKEHNMLLCDIEKLIDVKPRSKEFLLMVERVKNIKNIFQTYREMFWSIKYKGDIGGIEAVDDCPVEYYERKNNIIAPQYIGRYKVNFKIETPDGKLNGRMKISFAYSNTDAGNQATKRFKEERLNSYPPGTTFKISFIQYDIYKPIIRKENINPIQSE
jgi:hypothetical protein